MSLRLRFAVILCCVVGLYTALSFYMLHWRVLSSFERLEKVEAEEDFFRCVAAIHREIQVIDTLCMDWGAWEDSYEFINNQNAEFVEENLVDNILSALNLSVLLFYDTTGVKVWGRSADLESGEALAFQEFSKAALPPDHPILKLPLHRDDLSDSGLTGAYQTEHGPLIFSARPIITSEYKGPVRGTLIMGRLLSEGALSRFQKRVRIDFTLGQTKDLSEAFVDSLPRIGGSLTNTPPLLVTESDAFLSAYAILDDIEHSDKTYLHAHLPRRIYAEGQKTLRFVTNAAIIGMLLVLLTLLITVRRFVLFPVLAIIRKIENVAQVTDLSVRLPRRGQDELTNLVDSINNMLDVLHDKDVKLKKLAEEDPLTGVKNRRFFMEQAALEFARCKRYGEPMSLLMLDVDLFKNINDRYGHPAGDAVLCQLAKEASLTLRENDVFCRMGGEEFAALLIQSDAHQALTTAERIRKKMESSTVSSEGHAIQFTVSVGLTTLTPDDETLESLLHRIDKALYAAKDKGRNCTIQA